METTSSLICRKFPLRFEEIPEILRPADFRQLKTGMDLASVRADSVSSSFAVVSLQL